MGKFNPAEHLTNLKGKDYLEVKYRIQWFREEHPLWKIQTEIVELVYGDHCVMKAWIWDPEKETIYSEAHGSECVKDFGDYIEKAETKAIGRALAMLGYGTQFAPELEEGDRIVDAPVERKKASAPAKAPAKPVKVEKPQPTQTETRQVKARCCACDAPLFEATDGRKYENKIYCNECLKKGVHKL